MPVTAKLSRRFYEKFGDEITNEFVDWFNQVDATYRMELERLAEGYYQRFDARLEQRLAETKAELRSDLARLEARLDRLDGRFDGLDGRFDGLDGRFDWLRDQLRTEFGARIETRCAQVETRLIRWMVALWLGQIATLYGLLKLTL